MATPFDLTDRTFGDWTVLGRAKRTAAFHGHAYWHCRCACGRLHTVRGAALRTKESRRCRSCAAYIASTRTGTYRKKPQRMPTATTLGYSYESRFEGRYFAVLRRTLWRGREGTKFIVGYYNEADAKALVRVLSAAMLKEGPRPE